MTMADRVFFTLTMFSMIPWETEAICDIPTVWTEALECCKSRGNQLPSISFEDNTDLLEKMREHSTNSSWTDLILKDLEDWKWIDGSSAAGMNIDGSGCALVNLSSRYIYSRSCTSLVSGTMCRFNACRSCYELGSLSRMCLRKDGHCYVFLCEERNWYIANAICISLKATLAVFDYNKEFLMFPQTYLCDTFWIGASTLRWLHLFSNKTLSEAEETLWEPLYPKTKENCSTFHISKYGYRLQSADCREKRPYVCMEELIHVTPGGTQSDQYDNTTSFSRNNAKSKEFLPVAIYWIIGSMTLLAVLLTLISACYKIMKRVQKRRAEEIARGTIDKESNDTITVEEAVPMLEAKQPQETYVKTETQPQSLYEDDYFHKCCFTGKAVHVVDCDRETGLLFVKYADLSRVLSHPGFNDDTCPLVVLSIAGPFRSGKSFLMNYLLRYLLAREIEEESLWMTDEAEPLNGFKWGHGTEVTTLGIWIWSKPIKIKLRDNSQVSILIMDTQGLYEINKKAQQAATMTTLACMLSTMQIYNTLVDLTVEDLERINVFDKAASIIRQVAKGDSHVKGTLLKVIYFVVRDWTADGHFIHGLEGGTKYIENLLKIKQTTRNTGQSKVIEDFKAQARQWHCFLMDQPGRRAAGTGTSGYNGNLAGLALTFKRGLDDLAKHMLSDDNINEMLSGHDGCYGVNLCRQFVVYVSALNANFCAMPVSTSKELIKDTNKLAFNKAAQGFYESLLQISRKQLAMSDRLIRHLTDMAIETYDGITISDDESSLFYRKKLQENIDLTNSHTGGNQQQYPDNTPSIFIKTIAEYKKKIQQITESSKGDEIGKFHKKYQQELLGKLTCPQLKEIFLGFTDYFCQNITLSCSLRQ